MRPRRKCLPSLEREAYITAALQQGCTDLTSRTKNRYIDEFLRFCHDRFDHHQCRRLKREHIEAFARHLYETSWKWATANAKLTEVLRWLHAKGSLKRDLAADMTARKMLDELHVELQRHVMATSAQEKKRKNSSRSSSTSSDDPDWDDW